MCETLMHTQHAYNENHGWGFFYARHVGVFMWREVVFFRASRQSPKVPKLGTSFGRSNNFCCACRKRLKLICLFTQKVRCIFLFVRSLLLLSSFARYWDTLPDKKKVPKKTLGSQSNTWELKIPEKTELGIFFGSFEPFQVPNLGTFGDCLRRSRVNSSNGQLVEKRKKKSGW